MRSLLIIRQTVGTSMLPALSPGKLVVASGLYNQIAKGDLVIFTHQGIEKIKRIGDIRRSEFYVLGDNTTASDDSRVFGWLPLATIKAKVIWPIV